MQIKSIDEKILDTDRMPDMRAEMAELVEKSGIRNFAIKNKGACHIFLAVPGEVAWTSMHFDSKMGVDFFLTNINSLMLKITDNKIKIALVPNEEPSI